MSLYAKWEITKYTVQYQLENGVNAPTNPKVNTILDSFILAKHTRIGYEFMGWTYGDQQEPNRNITIEAGTTGNIKFIAL